MSTENPPNDPSCSCSPLHLTSSSNELGQSSVDHHQHNHHLPNFSIRDYVCSSRNKDIKNNWPFSLKFLQLCLKHGINDPLPPFQPPHAVEDQCVKICSTEAHSSPEKQIESSVELKIPVCLSDKSELDYLGTIQALAGTSKGIDSSTFCQSRDQNDDLLPTPSVSQSEIELVTFNKNPSKKCGLILKSGACVSRASREDSCIATSESMASKICPVCKTFSSASNTTLNAHIDQCLSTESAPSHSKPSRHRIKPRKIRPMTDIYATAKVRTLEELDKLNEISSCAADKSEVLNKGKKRKALLAHPNGDAGDVGPVYVDASGRKLRILSEFNENTSSVLREHKDKRVKKKSVREGKRSKCFPTKMKSHRRKKHHKYLKLTPQSRKLFSSKANVSEISVHQEGYTGEGSGKEKLQIPKQSKPGQPRTLNCRMSTKQIGLARKVNREGNKFLLSRDQPFEGDDSWWGDSTEVISPTHKSVDLSGSTVASLNKQKVWEPCGATPVMKKNGTLFGNKRARNPSSRVRIVENKETPLATAEQNTNKSRKNVPSFKENFPAQKTFSMDTGKYKDVSSSATHLRNLSATFAAKASRFSLSESKLSTSEALAIRQLKKGWPHLSGKDEEEISRLSGKDDELSDLLGKEDEDLWKWETEMDQERAFTDNDSDESERGQELAFTDNGEMDEELVSPDSSLSDDDDYNDDGSFEEDVKAENDGFDETDEAEAAFYHPDTPPSTEICNGSTIPRGQPMNSTEEVENRIHRQTARVGTDPDCHEVGRGSSVMEVDPIPIPGPPGSFLPSPRGMGSDDFPGNSSVTTSQVQSSQDQLDHLDRNSSESPVSMVSANSNSAAGRSSRVNHPLESTSIQEKVPRSYSTSTMNSGASSQETNAGVEWTSDTEKFDFLSVSIDKRPTDFRNNDQPCCCQRKESSSEGIIDVNYRESQLLKQSTMSSLTLPEAPSPVGLDPMTLPSNSDTVLDSSEPHVFRDSDLQRKFPHCIHHASAGPPTPVLRLMGKDLMVVNQQEDISTPISHGESILSSTPEFLDPSRTSKTSIQTFYHETPQFSSPLLQSLSAGTSICFRNNASSTAPQSPPTDALQGSFGRVTYFCPR